MRSLFIAALVPAMALARLRGAPIASSSSPTTQSPEASYLNLPAGADETLDQRIDTSFSCSGRPFGYYADMNNDCKLYHICNPSELPDGQRAVLQYSFMCPAKSTFDQQTMTCVFEPSAECSSSDKFYNLNEQFGATTNFHGQSARANANGMQRYAPTAPVPAPVPAPAPAAMPYAPSAAGAGGAPLATRTVFPTPNAAVPAYYVPVPTVPVSSFYPASNPQPAHHRQQLHHHRPLFPAPDFQTLGARGQNQVIRSG